MKLNVQKFILIKNVILKYIAGKRGIFIEEKKTVDEEIKEYEKNINYKELFLEKTDSIIKPQILGNKIKRNINENKEEEKSLLDYDNSESESLDDDDDEKFYEKMLKKYGFNDDGRIFTEIDNKLKDNSITPKEKFQLECLFYFLNEVE